MAKKFQPVIPLLFFAIYGVWLAFAYPYHLHFKEQITLFTGDWNFYLQKPAVIGEFLGDYLTQFYLLTGVSSIILTGLLLVLWLGIQVAFKKIGITRNTAWLALLPVAAEAALSCLLEYPLSMVVGSTVAVWTFVAMVYLKNKRVFFIIACIVGIILYLLIGAHFLLFIFLVLAEEIRRKNHWIIPVSTLMIALAIPLIASRFYYLTFPQAYFYPLIERYLLKKPFLFLLTETSMLAALILSCYKIKKVFLYIFILIVAPLEIYAMCDFKEEYNLGLTSEAYFGNWNKVKSLSEKQKYNTYLSAYYGNLANARDGKLADELLKQYQPAHFGLFLEISETGSYINLIASADALIECGDMAQAQHSALLSMLFTPHQRSSRMTRKLAEIAIANGEYPTAEKYLHLLSKTTLHHRWAEENRQLIASDTVFNFSGNRAFLSQRDTLFHANDWRASLINLIESNPLNKTAADYLLCYHLLRKDLKLFQADYDTYYYPTFGDTPSVIYQEALLICMSGDDEQQYVAKLRKYHINKEVWSKHQEFFTLLKNRQQNETKILSTFATSYWFYFFYAQLQ